MRLQNRSLFNIMGDGKILNNCFVSTSIITGFDPHDFPVFAEEVIRRRLLIDGDGTGDDRRLNVLLKTLIKWCNDDKPEDR